MKKIEITKETVNELIIDYTNNLLSSNKLVEKYKLPKKRILLLLKENNVEVRKSGRFYSGGRSGADKRYHEKNKEKRSLYYSKWRKDNIEYLKGYHKNWRNTNIDKHRKTARNYDKIRKTNDPKYKLIAYFRTAICVVLKENNLTKRGHYFDILGYTQDELKKHLESKFKDGICWDNYGKWHVDHIRPISSFNFTDIDDDDFKICWSLDNLQPMWGFENIAKSNNY